MKLSIIMPVRNGEEWVLRALQSIPKSKDIEIIVIDDCSLDDTYSLVETYSKYADKNIRLFINECRGYASSCINYGIELAHGDYFTQLDCDDYLITKNFLKLFQLDRTEDVIFFHNEIDSGEIWKPEECEGYCDHVCWYKKSFVGDIRHAFGKTGTGWQFHRSILAKNPTVFYYKEPVYHYTYPREGSNYDLAKKGLL